MAEDCVNDGKHIYEIELDNGEMVMFFVGTEDELEKKFNEFVEDNA